jgi:hypothetical protein
MSGTVTVTTIPSFDPPGFPDVNDNLTPALKAAWSKNISSWMNTEINAKDEDGNPLRGPRGSRRTPLPQFFNGTVTAFNTSQSPTPITWIAFPNIVSSVDGYKNLPILCHGTHFVQLIGQGRPPRQRREVEDSGPEQT